MTEATAEPTRPSRILDRAEEIILVVLLGTIVFVSFIDVIVRNVGGTLSHVQQILPNVFVWLVWLGIPYGIRKREHFRVRILPARTRRSILKPLRIVGAAVAITFFAAMVLLGASVVMMDIRYGNTTPLGFPAALLDIAVPIGSLLALVRIVQSFFAEQSGDAADGAADARAGAAEDKQADVTS